MEALEALEALEARMGHTGFAASRQAVLKRRWAAVQARRAVPFRAPQAEVGPRLVEMQAPARFPFHHQRVYP